MSIQLFSTLSTPFLGRQDELWQIAELLDNPGCRLLTLVGPGGIGKTRLAQATAAQANYADGVYFVALQPVAESRHIVQAIADALHVRFSSGSDPKAHLLAYLKQKSCLLILDNLEHLLDGVGLIAEILAAAPGVKALATSRERLNLVEEWAFDVGGLPYPADDEAADFEAYGSVQLFIQTAQRVRPGFSINGEQAAIAHICRHLEGMPLAIEFAASWARTLSIPEIARQVDQGLDILVSSARNRSERHRSMRAVLDHSWALLSQQEQSVLGVLSVFRGGFTLEAAEAVAGAALPLLASLADKSWLRFDPHSQRYDVHELLRQYAAERLEQAGEHDAARAAHVA